MKSSGKYIWKSLFVLLITAIVLYYFMHENISGILKLLGQVNLLWFGLAIAIIFLSWFFRTAVYDLVLRKQKCNFGFKKELIQIIKTHFYNGVTPFETGGQPMQIYMLTKNGVDFSKASSVIVQDSFFYQCGLLLISTIIIILNSVLNIVQMNPMLWSFTAIGFGLNFLMGVFFLYISFAKKSAKKMVFFATKVVKKLKILKVKSNFEKELLKKVEDFQKQAVMFKKQKTYVVKAISLNVLSIGIRFFVPYFIFLSLGFSGVELFSTMIIISFVHLIGSIVPLPGGMAGIEGSYLLFFTPVIKDAVLLKSSMLLWRFVTYYFGMMLGALFVNIYKDGDKKNE